MQMIDEYSRMDRAKEQNARVSDELSREVKLFNMHLALTCLFINDPTSMRYFMRSTQTRNNILIRILHGDK